MPAAKRSSPTLRGAPANKDKPVPKDKSLDDKRGGQGPFLTADAAAAFERFLPLAEAIPEADVVAPNVDLSIARHNIERGLAAIRPHLDLVRSRLPLCPIDEVRELPSIALAAVVAADRVGVRASDGEVMGKLAELRPMRERALVMAEILADLGHVPAERVRAIRAGNGPLDSARDAMALQQLFKEHWDAVEGKHPFSRADLADLGERGQWLFARLRPGAAVSEPAKRGDAAVLRDRFWTLLVQRHEHLREAGVVVFGLRALDESVPPLGSRIAPAPAVTVAPPTAEPPVTAQPAPA